MLPFCCVLLLPAGTVHVCLPGLLPVCRALGVDYAPALTGFDVQGGRMVPRIEGVVVCQVRRLWIGACVKGEGGPPARQGHNA